MDFYEKVEQLKQAKQAERDASLQKQLKLDQERDQFLAGFQSELTGWLDAIGVDYEVIWEPDESTTGDGGRCIVLQGRIDLYHEGSCLESANLRYAKRIFQKMEEGTTFADAPYGSSHWRICDTYSSQADIKSQQELEDYLIKIYADRI